MQPAGFTFTLWGALRATREELVKEKLPGRDSTDRESPIHRTYFLRGPAKRESSLCNVKQTPSTLCEVLYKLFSVSVVRGALEDVVHKGLRAVCLARRLSGDALDVWLRIELRSVVARSSSESSSNDTGHGSSLCEPLSQVYDVIRQPVLRGCPSL